MHGSSDLVVAFLNVGPTEIVLILLLYFLLFGAEKLPEVARQLGKLSARWTRTKAEITESLLTADERALAEQTRFERMRERQMAEQVATSAEPVPQGEEPASRTK
ncbi:MAG: twin-arginine translocase TatA/TatE family subunit [Thermoplasmatota archaeon]